MSNDFRLQIDCMNESLPYSYNGAYQYPDKKHSWDDIMETRYNCNEFEQSNELQRNYNDTKSNIGMQFFNQNHNWNQSQYPYGPPNYLNDYQAYHFPSFMNPKISNESTISHEPFSTGGNNLYKSHNLFSSFCSLGK